VVYIPVALADHVRGNLGRVFPEADVEKYAVLPEYLTLLGLNCFISP
jgi:hypothetical protein